MTQRWQILVLTLTLTLTLMLGGMMLSSPAEARRDKADKQASQQQGLSLEQAVARVQKKSKGKVLAADVKQKKDRTLYRIKVLMPSGHVRIYHVDARSGETE